MARAIMKVYKSGEPQIWRPGDFLCCCDCGLVHELRFKVLGPRRLEVVLEVDRRRTAAVRREDKRRRSR